jgi:hypothetical protein
MSSFLIQIMQPGRIVRHLTPKRILRRRQWQLAGKCPFAAVAGGGVGRRQQGGQHGMEVKMTDAPLFCAQSPSSIGSISSRSSHAAEGHTSFFAHLPGGHAKRG